MNSSEHKSQKHSESFESLQSIGSILDKFKEKFLGDAGVEENIIKEAWYSLGGLTNETIVQKFDSKTRTLILSASSSAHLCELNLNKNILLKDLNEKIQELKPESDAIKDVKKLSLNIK